MADKYRNFAALEAAEDRDAYRIEPRHRKSDVLVAAPHGGAIEAHTSLIARAIAGTDLSYYLFEGRKQSGNTDLHITSAHFDEPKFERLASLAEVVLTVHGKAATDDVTYLGGAYNEGILEVMRCLKESGFEARRETRANLQGRDAANICNRGRRGRGVQLEIARPMRNTLASSSDVLLAYATSVRAALSALGLI
jgi:phage replication-related protein YjqB (UPF0714/DUF867 family)